MIEIGTKILDVVCLLFRLCTPGGAQGLLVRGVTLFDGALFRINAGQRMRRFWEK
jgi:hypothetical protein